MIRWTVGLVLLILTVWLGVGWYVADQFLSRAIPEYDEIEELRSLADVGLSAIDREAVQFVSGDSVLAATFFRHPQPNDCAVILIPGIGGSRTQVLPILPLFWDLNCHVLAYDPRGTGGSTRVPRSFGFFEKEDNVAALRWVSQHTGLAETSIGVWGPSFGAAVGLMTLERLPDIGFVIADSTFAAFDRVAKETIAQLSNELVADLITPLVLTILEARTGMRVEDVAPARSIAKSTTPILLVHALNDPAMNIEHSREVYANRTSSLVELEITDWGAGHGDSAVVDPARYKVLVRSFLARHQRTKHLVQ